MIHPRHTFEEHGQGQVFRFFDDLPPAQQDELTRQASEIDLDEIDRLVRTLVTEPLHPDAQAIDIEPADYIPAATKDQDPKLWQAAVASGEKALRDERVAAFTVAGGQGTRLGFEGPKGTFPVTPVTGKFLFQVFAEKIAAAQSRYQSRIPWFIMTSEGNHEETLAFFRSFSWFGLDPDQVHLFPQGTLPAVDREGKILLANRHRIALSPDGHGGSLRALLRSGATKKMRAAGIDILSCFQVDNPLVKCIDPAFIGFHLNQGSQLSSKMVEKRSPDEKVGVFCQRNGRYCVIEYSDLPEQLQHEKDSQGALRFRSGSVAIHLFDLDLVEQLGAASGSGTLPFHAAWKKVPTLDESGQTIDPAEPNAVKFEMFLFDALPLAQNPLVFETRREEEFSPVKNAVGDDSPETSRRDQLRQFGRWFQAAGVELPCDESGTPQIAVEISPAFADSEEEFVSAWQSLAKPPAVEDGLVL